MKSPKINAVNSLALPEIDLAELTTQEAIDALEARLLHLPQTEVPLIHSFAPGVYLREVTMRAGTFVIGQRHKTEHFNIVLTGRARVLIGDGQVATVQAPCVLKSNAGIRKVLLIEEEMRWITIHPTKETDIPTLEAMLIEKTPAFIDAEHNRAEKLEEGSPCHS